MKKRGIKIIISAILFVLALVIPFSNELINNGLFIISYLVVGFEILKKAVRNIFRGKVFDEISNGKISIHKLESSDFYNKIEERVYFLTHLEYILDNNETIFKYNKYKTRLCKY